MEYTVGIYYAWRIMGAPLQYIYGTYGMSTETSCLGDGKIFADIRFHLIPNNFS